jgi:DNA mismatch repair protein MutS
MNQYRAVKQQYGDCLLFFRLGDFYELFYDDAKIAAEILGITLTKRVQKNEIIPMAGVPVHTCDYYISKLIKVGQKIAICDQVETAALKTDKIIRREVVRIITPGTLTDDVLLESKRNNFLIALFSNNFDIAAAIFDLSTNEFYLELIEPSSLDEFLEKIEPNELIIGQNFIATFKQYNVWKNIITLVPEMNVKLAKEQLCKFFGLHSVESLNFDNQDFYCAAAMIINYISYTQKQLLDNIALPKQKNTSDILRLDQFTRRNLEIMKTLQNEHKGSLCWLLDHTKTGQGGRLLFKLINEPISNIAKLNDRYDKIEYFLKDRSLLQKTRDVLRQIPDFERLLSKIALGRFSHLDLRNLAIGMKNFAELPNIQNVIRHDELINILLNAISDSSNSIIKKGFDVQLDEQREFITDIDAQIANLQEQYRCETQIGTLRIKFLNNLGYFIEIGSSHKEKLLYNFLPIQDLKTTARYMSSALEQLNHKFMNLQESIAQREHEIIDQLSKRVLCVRETIIQYGQISAEIDVFANFANIALENRYVRPVLTNDKSFEVRAGRHPILDAMLERCGQSFVSNDCNLEVPILFMTGPNMAGKSTYLRQQGLIALLSHIGMFVPADYAKIGMIDRIFSRIGAGDDLMNGASTFMMEMIEIALTVNQAADRSFIIFDEVGRGTSSHEGAAIAQAVLEYLTVDLGARALFATHYLELSDYKHVNLQQKMMEIVENSSEEFVRFTYRVVDGVAEKSWALNVAAMAGLPEKIIVRARQLENYRRNDCLENMMNKREYAN